MKKDIHLMVFSSYTDVNWIGGVKIIHGRTIFNQSQLNDIWSNLL